MVCELELKFKANNTSPTGTTWSNMTAPVMDSFTDGFESCSAGTTPTAVVTEIQGASSTTNWQSLGSDGQYRLVSYTYQPDAGIGLNEAPGTGILTVEGRNVGADDVISRLTVEIPIITDLHGTKMTPKIKSKPSTTKKTRYLKLS